MTGGYIKLYRQLTTHEMWLSEPFTRGQAWVDILLRASHRPTSVRIRGIRVPLLRGQLALSEREFAERWQWSRGKVRRFITELETVQQIVPQPTNITTILTITNYDEYQGDGTTDRTANGTTSSTTDGPQTDPYKKGKKGKNEKEEEEDKAVAGAPAPVAFEDHPEPDKPKADTVKDEWNAIASEYGLSKVIDVKGTRLAQYRKRYAEGMRLKDIGNELVAKDFLTGSGPKGWRMTFDWLVGNDKNWKKVMEDNYLDTGNGGSFRQPGFDDIDVAAMRPYDR